MLRQPVGSATNANMPFKIVGETLFPCLATLSAVPFFWLWMPHPPTSVVVRTNERGPSIQVKEGASEAHERDSQINNNIYIYIIYIYIYIYIYTYYTYYTYIYIYTYIIYIHIIYIWYILYMCYWWSEGASQKELHSWHFMTLMDCSLQCCGTCLAFGFSYP